MTEHTDDITKQLRALGRAVEDSTTAATPQQILDAPPSIEVDQVPAPLDAVRQRRLVPLLAAAAVVALAIGSFTLLTRADPTAELDTAFAQQSESGPDDDNGWEELRQCESTGDYAIDTGNTFYGAYQFTRESWRVTAYRIGLESWADMNPAATSPAVQDVTAAALYDQRGADPWPICGHLITGPMITPHVPQWMNELPDPNENVEVIVFMNPDATPEQHEGIMEHLRLLTSSTYEQVVTFVDQEASFAEFQELFADQDQVRELASVNDMPTSYRIGPGLSPTTLRSLRQMPGVFEVIFPPQSFEPSPAPRKLVIEDLGVEVALFADARTTDLAAGAGVIAQNQRGLVVAGYGSFADSVFGDIAALAEGDVVSIHELIENQDDGALEVVKTYEVVAVPETLPVAEIEAFNSTNKLVGLILVADVAGDPDLRTVVRLSIATPDRASYGLSDS